MILRYEDLVEYPTQKLAEVLNFCNLPVDNVILDYAVDVLNMGTNHSIIDIHPVLEPLFEDTMSQLGY
jgi:hypothetical protein